MTMTRSREHALQMLCDSLKTGLILELQYHTYDEWITLDRNVKRGEQASAVSSLGEPLFERAQTEILERDSGPSEGDYET